VCRLEEPITDSKGTYIGKKKRLTAEFIRGGCPQWAIQEALKRFEFRGRNPDIPIEMMIGVFDSAWARDQFHWSDEEHDAVVRHLRTNSQYWFIAEQPKIGAPFPSLDKLKPHGRRTAQLSAEQIIDVTEKGGFSLEDVIRYVTQESWDPKVVEILQAALVEQQKTEEDAEELVEA
jgi:hypothetical protein